MVCVSIKNGKWDRNFNIASRFVLKHCDFVITSG